MTTIEPLDRADFDLVARWLSTPRVHRWLTAEWRDRAVDATALAIATRQKRHRWFCVRCDGEACGVVALGDCDPVDHSAMLWYFLGRADLGGRGVMTEAVRLLVAVAFEALELNAIYAWAMQPNAASIRVLRKAGFRPAGRLRLSATLDGQPVHRLYFDLTRAEWRAAQAPRPVAAVACG